MNSSTIKLTLTRFAKLQYDSAGNATNRHQQERIVVAPETVEQFGQLFRRGRRGSRLVAQVNGEIWEAIRGNNESFFERFDKVKKPFWRLRAVVSHGWETVKLFSADDKATLLEAIK